MGKVKDVQDIRVLDQGSMRFLITANPIFIPQLLVTVEKVLQFFIIDDTNLFNLTICCLIITIARSVTSHNNSNK